MKKIVFLMLFAAFGCTVENINYTTPLIETYEAENIQSTSAGLGGIVLNEGGKDVTSYGIVYSTSPEPTIADNTIEVGSRIGEFFSVFQGFNSGTTYYYRVYATNSVGTGYGETKQFTTGGDIACNPSVDNRVQLNPGNTINIDEVEFSHPSWGFNEGNVEFVTTSWSDTARITVQFNEINQQMPMTGTYTVTNGEFGNDIDLSTGQAKLFISDYGWPSLGGATAEPGTQFYVLNDGSTVSIIFCETEVGPDYTLNGKFSYSGN